MHKEKVLEVFELSDGVIRCFGGLLALKAADSDSHMGSIDHVDIIGAVSDCQC